jgi:hypothetical protein
VPPSGQGSASAPQRRSLLASRTPRSPLASAHEYGMATMDSDVPSGAAAQAFDYSQLNDEQLRSAIRFAEKHLRWVQEDHTALLRAYREEINAMRRHL